MDADLEIKLTSSDEEERRIAVDSLKSDGSSEARESIYIALGDESWRVRKTAVDSILHYKDAEGLVDSLIESLRNEKNPGLRNSSIEVLVKIGSPTVTKLLTLFDDSDPDIRKFACDILGEIKEPSSITAIGGLLSDEDNNVRSSASETLGKIGGSEVVGVLVDALEMDNLWLRFSTLQALGKVGTGVPYEPVVKFFEDQMLRKGVLDALASTNDNRAIPYFLKGLGDKSSTTRNSAVLGLSKFLLSLSTDEIVNLSDDIRDAIDKDLISAMLDSHSMDIKKGLVIILTVAKLLVEPEKLIHTASEGHIVSEISKLFLSCKDESYKFLTSNLSKFNDRERALACSLFGDIGVDQDVSPVLRNALKDSYGHTRRCALLSLSKLNSIGSISDMVMLLDDEYEDVAGQAVSSIANISSHSPQSKVNIIKMLTADFKEASPTLRSNIISVVGRIGDSGDEEIVLSAMKDEDSKVRQSGVLALGSINPSDSFEHLSIALTDESHDVRLSTISVLGDLKSRESEKVLVLALKDEDSWIKSAAIRSLALIGTDSAVEAIGSVISGDTVVVAMTALDSIEELRGKRGIKYLEKGLLHADSTVVEAAKGKIESVNTN